MMIRKLIWIAAVTLTWALPASAQTGDPIKIGFTTLDAGAFAFIRSHYTDPAKLAVETINAEGGILGRKLELVIQAHAGTPTTAQAAVTRLVEQEKTSFILGQNTSPIAMLLAPRVAGMNAIMLDSNAQTDDLTTKTCYPNYFRTNAMNASNVAVLARFVKSSGYKTWSVIGPDFAIGHDFVKVFKSIIEESGGTLQTVLLAPLNTPDYGSYISQLLANPTEGLAVIVIGADATIFAKQQKQFGVFSRYKMVVAQNFTNDVVLAAQGDTTVGTYAVSSYSPEMPFPKNAAFVRIYRERFNRPPTYLEAETWQAFEVLQAAITKAGSTDVSEVRKALVGLKTNTILGDVEIRAADHQMVRPMALTQVVEAGEGKGRLTMQQLVSGESITPPAVLKCD